MPQNARALFRRLRAPLSGVVVLAATTFLALGAASPASAVTISATYDTVSLTATPATLSVGDTVTVSAVFTGLVDAYAYELDISYDAKLLAFIDDSEQLPSGGFDSVTDRGGEIGIAATRLGTSPGLAGTQTLVTLTFTALDEGDASFAISSGRIVGSNAQTSTVDPAAAGASTIVEISSNDDAEPGSGDNGSFGADPGSGPGSPLRTGSGSAADGSLAITGTDAAPWLILGAGAIAAAAAGTIIAIRRRTR
ncbi:cohesin domain-containing protein [Microbacterium sp. NPDC090281]|uniref:cohesin domain-containing protein n=1 Tax=Microbacterium sp. NPDC090281 TaxID=3364208 RepID=UPI0038217D0D